MIKTCEDCGKEFKVSKHNSRWCEDCLIVRVYDPPKNKNGTVNRKYLLKPRDFTNFSVQKQWQETAKKTRSKLLENVRGITYIQK